MEKKAPTNLMRKTAVALFPDAPGEQDSFLDALLSPVPRGSAVVWTVPRREGDLETVDRATLPDWVPDSVALLAPEVKAGRSEAYLAGHLYPLDFSSFVTGSAILAIRERLPKDPRVIDLCAAPGGKSILASQFLKPGLLLANEVEPKRLGILRHNLGRCRIANAYTQRMLPEELARLADSRFHLCLVDAPCSGQSLLAKGIENPGCFHPSMVKGNARRQLRILEAAAETVAVGGYLLYTTCTFSQRENEGVVEKFLRSAASFEAVEVPHLEDLRSPFSPHPVYRVYPHRSPGAGGFAALLRRSGEHSAGEDQELARPLLDYPVAISDEAKAR